MKVRVLFAPSTERYLRSGEVYDLPDAEAADLIASGDGEGVDRKVAGLPDPRPVAEPET